MLEAHVFPTMSSGIIVAVCSYYSHVVLAHSRIVEHGDEDNVLRAFNRTRAIFNVHCWVVGNNEFRHQVQCQETQHCVGSKLDQSAPSLSRGREAVSNIGRRMGRLSRRQGEMHSGVLEGQRQGLQSVTSMKRIIIPVVSKASGMWKEQHLLRDRMVVTRVQVRGAVADRAWKSPHKSSSDSLIPKPTAILLTRLFESCTENRFSWLITLIIYNAIVPFLTRHL